MRIVLIGLISILLISCSQRVIDVPIVTEKTTKTILALGDSLTIWLWLPESESYPSLLQVRLDSLGYTYRIENAGISWDTTAGLLSRLDWVLEWDAPSLIILCIGANDAFQGKSVTDIETNIRTIIEKIQNKKIPILFAGMIAPYNLGTEYRSEYDALFPKLAKEYKLPFVPFLLEWVAMQTNLNQADRIHPNREWYTIVVENLITILEKEKLIMK